MYILRKFISVEKYRRASYEIRLIECINCLSTGWNGLPACGNDFDIGFANFGLGLHFGHGGQVAHIIGHHHCAWCVHVRYIAFLPGIA